LEGLGDSLDLVPIGAWWGQGRKAGWWSPILLACHNPETGALEAVCKCKSILFPPSLAELIGFTGISGFTDQFYKDLLVRYPPEGNEEKCSKRNMLGYYETNGLRPDVWFSPDEVWEIRGAELVFGTKNSAWVWLMIYSITLSPVYPAAASLLGSERGLSIRFPRFMKLRDDKTFEQATTSEQFAEMYRHQIKEAPAREVKPAGEVIIRQGSEEAEAEGLEVEDGPDEAGLEEDEEGEEELDD
jgi:DNA ligase-1